MSIHCSLLSSTPYCLLHGFTKLPTMSLLFLSILCVIARDIIQNLFSGLFFFSVRTARLINKPTKPMPFPTVYLLHIFLVNFSSVSFPHFSQAKILSSQGSAVSDYICLNYISILVLCGSGPFLAQDFTVKFPASHSWLFSFSIIYMYSL